MKRMMILAVAVALFGGAARAEAEALSDAEYIAFVAAHSNEVHFLGVNMYSLEPPQWKSWGVVHSDGPQGGRAFHTRSGDVKLSHPIGGHRMAQLTSGCDDASSVGCLKVGEAVERKFSLGAERHWVEKTASEITTLTGISIAVVDVRSNKWIHAFGTNATLQVRVEASACTRRINGGSEQAITDRRVFVTPQFRRKAKPVPKPSAMPDPEVDVDI